MLARINYAMGGSAKPPTRRSNLESRVRSNKSQEIARSTQSRISEFNSSQGNPIELFRKWFEKAKTQGAQEPDALALGTADHISRTSVRFVQMVNITDTGIVFITNDESQKGRDIAATKWASGALYWRETRQQVILAGMVERLSSSESDALWTARPIDAQIMAVASKQSAPLDSEQELYAETRRLAKVGELLQRPSSWSGYHLIADMIEFWQESPDRFHHRLRYNRADGWTAQRLQP